MGRSYQILTSEIVKICQHSEIASRKRMGH